MHLGCGKADLVACLSGLTRTDKELHFEGVAAPGIAAWKNTTSKLLDIDVHV